MLSQMPRKLHKVADDCTEPAPANRLPGRIIPFLKRFLTDNAQNIISDNGKFQYQFVTVKLSRWKSFNIHVCFDLAVILLTFAMRMIEIDDLLIGQWEVCPVCGQFDIRYDKKLPILVNRALRNLVDRPDTNGFF